MFDNIRKRLNTYAKRWPNFVNWLKRKKYRAYFWLSETPRILWGRVRTHFLRHLSRYLTAIYALAMLGAVVGLYQPVVGADQDTVTGFIYGSAAMFGGMLAIIFTFNTLIVNFAIDQYPPEFYRLSGYNKTLDVVYFALGGLTLSQFLMGYSYHKGHTTNGLVAIIAVCAVFMAVYLLYVAFSLTRTRMSPIEGLRRIRNRAVRILNIGDKFAKRYVALHEQDPDLTPEQRRVLTWQPYSYLHASYVDLNKYLSYLDDYHTKLIEKSNYQTALKAMEVTNQILLKYLDVNKRSLAPMLNNSADPMSGYTTVGGPFMSENYERLQNKTRFYIARDDVTGLKKMADIFVELATKTLEMDFSVLPINENPEFSRCVGYMAMLCDEIAASNSVNAMFYFAQAMGECGQLAIPRGLHLESATVYEKLDVLAKAAATKRRDEVFMQIARVFIALAAKCIDHRVPDRDMKSYLQTLNHVICYFVLTTSDRSYTTMNMLTRPYVAFAASILDSVPNASNPARADRVDQQNYIIATLEQLRASLMELCRTIPLVDRIIVLELARMLEALSTNLTPNLEKRTWQGNATRLRGGLTMLAYIPQWFAHNQKQIENNFIDNVIDKSGRVALNATQHHEPQVTKAAISSISVLVKHMLDDKQHVDFDAPRAMVGVAALTIVALERGEYEIAGYCREAVVEFNKMYVTKFYPSGLAAVPREFRGTQPYPAQLFFELKNSFGNFNGSSWGNPGLSIDPGLDEIIAKTPNRTQADYIMAAKFLKRKK